MRRIRVKLLGRATGLICAGTRVLARSSIGIFQARFVRGFLGRIESLVSRNRDEASPGAQGAVKSAPARRQDAGEISRQHARLRRPPSAPPASPARRGPTSANAEPEPFARPHPPPRAPADHLPPRAPRRSADATCVARVEFRQAHPSVLRVLVEPPVHPICLQDLTKPLQQSQLLRPRAVLTTFRNGSAL